MWEVYTAGGISPQFGYVILVAIFAIIQHSIWFSFKVGQARRKFNLQPPIMYATPSKNDERSVLVGLTEDQCDEFNRIQRVHQNNVEHLPTFFMMLLIAGIGFPVPATVFGLVWVAGRAAYAIGYYKDAKKRNIGAFFHLGELGLLILCFAFAIMLWIDHAPVMSG